MNIVLREHEGCFEFDITPNTLEEAAMLTRLTNNATREIRSLTTFTAKSAERNFATSLIIGRRRQSRESISAFRP